MSATFITNSFFKRRRMFPALRRLSTSCRSVSGRLSPACLVSVSSRCAPSRPLHLFCGPRSLLRKSKFIFDSFGLAEGSHRRFSMSASPTQNLKQPIKSETDTDRSYRAIRLENELDVLLVSEPKADKAAAALDVHVGAFDDPVELQGLAHFCEHMLFLGTEKYPVENSYSEFLSKVLNQLHGGSSNASTSSENTTYHFDVNKDFLKPALDIFAQFFLGPLFTESCTEREMNAVNSEHTKNLQEDSRRIRQVLRSLAHPDSDWGKFSTGSLETLNKPGIRTSLLDFHKANYSSNIMKLCVLGKESLDELESMVRELFSKVPNKALKLRSPGFKPPYPNDKVSTLVSIIPVKEVRQVRIHFPVPSSIGDYESKQSRYYTTLLGHEGEGSAFAFLKAKGWASGLNAGKMTRTYQFEIFEVKVDLTEAGFAHRDEVIEILLAYLQLVKSTPPQKWIFDETKKIDEIKFRFLSKASPQTFVTDRVDIMHEYPSEHYLDGSYYYGEFSEPLIRQYGDHLRPDKMMIVEVGKELEQRCTLTEVIYSVKYFTEPIESTKILKWMKGVPIPKELHLPVVNEFIPEDVALKPGYERRADESYEKTLEDLPRSISESPSRKVWYLRDRSFLKPKVSLAGYNDKLIVLLKKVFDRLVSLEIKPDRLEVYRQLLKEQLVNFYKDQPYAHATYYMNEATIVPTYSVEEQLRCVPLVTVEDLKYFMKEALSQLFITAFIHGNVTQDEACSWVDAVESVLKFRPVHESPSKKRVGQLPLGRDCITANSEPNPDNENSCSHIWWQVSHINDHKCRSKTWLLSDILKDPCYQQLRTKEQLGYIIWSGTRNVCNIEGIRITIQSGVKDPVYLDSRIDSFLIQFKKSLEDMTEAEFEKFKSARIAKFLEKPNALTQLYNIHWAEIRDLDEPLFRRNTLLAETTRTLTHKEILDHFNRFIFDEKSRRRLSSRVFGNKHPIGNYDQRLAYNSNEALVQSDKVVVIDDRLKFLASLPLYPIEYTSMF